MNSHTPLRRVDQVVFTGLDTSQLGIAISLLRGEVDGDGAAVRAAVMASFDSREVFASLLALLLLQARTAGDTLSVPGHGPVGAPGYLSLLAAVETDPARSLLMHQVSMSLRQDPQTDRLCLTLVSVFTLAAVCLNVAADLAERDNQTLGEHVEDLAAALASLNAKTA